MKNPYVLIVCAKKSSGERIARLLDPYSLEAVVARDLKDAILRMKERHYDMIVAESDLGKVSGINFLAQAKKHLPKMQRVLLETSPINIGMYALVNEVTPSAIFSSDIDPEKIWELLAIQNPVDPELQSSTKDKSSKHVKMTELEKLNFITDISFSLTGLMEDPDLVLPVLPEIANKVRKVMENERSNFDAIAELVETEQGMSARILQVANSPIYAGLERIRNIQQAVGRLGMRETYNILQAVIAQNLFTTPDKKLEEMMRDLWLHSLSVAYSNEMIAQKLNISDSQDFFMMGLLHDIGKLLIIHLIEQGRRKNIWDDRLVTEDILRKVLAMRHNDLGARLLEVWQYPMLFQDVVRLHDDDTNVERRSEAVIVSYFSNLLTRKIGLSLVPYDGDPLSDKVLADALNMTQEMRDEFEETLVKITDKIKQSCFAQ